MSRWALGMFLVGVLSVACKDDSPSSRSGDGGAGARDGLVPGLANGGAGGLNQGVVGTCARGEPSGGQFVSLQPIRKLDLLFMIDNSGSMREEQENLARNFKSLIQVLRQLPGGMPDLHIGVISSDVGAGNTPIPGSAACSVLGGDRGVLQARPNCGLNAGSLFMDVGEGGTRKNFGGEMEDVFACIASLGTVGCGFEQQLRSVAVALSSDVTPKNAGFLRADAHLGLIMITDEDDCSAPADTNLFTEVTPDQETSFRCNIEGHLCNGQPLPLQVFSTPLSNCTTNPRGRLLPIDEIVSFVKGLKPNGAITVSLIAGAGVDPLTARYETKMVEAFAGGPLVLGIQPVCRSAQGTAAPALRLQQFVAAFGDNGIVESICNGDFTPALTRIGARIADQLAVGCLPRKLVDKDATTPGVQPTCSVRERAANMSARMETTLPACAPNVPRPCWRVIEPGATGNLCPPAASFVQIDRAGAIAPGTEVAIQCVCDG